VLKACNAPKEFPTAHVHVIGCDEVGTGAIAGPIVAAAAYLPPHVLVPGLCDSKRMENSDELLTVFNRMRTENDILFQTCAMEAVAICEVGQGLATDNALATAYASVVQEACGTLDAQYRLARPFADVAAADRKISLKHAASTPILGAIFDGDRIPYGVFGNHSSCVTVTRLPQADFSCPSVAAASVFAKGMRDAHMNELDARYPEYGFADHKGYATERHLEAIRRHGPCPEHRASALQAAGIASAEDKSYTEAKAVLSAISAARIQAKRQAASAAAAAAAGRPSTARATASARARAADQDRQ
jgi:ribonuclease HII